VNDLVYLNGNRLTYELPLRTLFYGEGVFETFRYRSAMPEHFDKHIERLEEGANLLQLDMPEKGYIVSLIEKAVRESELSDLYVKFCLLSHGNTLFYEKSEEIQALILIKEYFKPKDSIRACVCSFPKNSQSPVVRIKSFNYLENIIARREAAERGFDEVVFFNEEKKVTEGGAGNIFWYKGGMLHTPSVGCGLLPGTTREIVMEISRGLNMDIVKGEYPLEDLVDSDFAFFTNSLIGSVPISQIDNRMIPLDNPKYGEIEIALYEALGWK